MLPPAEVPNPELPPGLQTAIPTSKLKLLDQVRREIRLRHYSLRTEEAYVDWIKRFIHFHKAKAAPDPSGGGEASGWRHPRDMGAAEVRQFLEHLATDRNVAAPTQDQALNALVFLYHGVLKIKLGELGEYLRANKPAHLPVVLARPEAQRLLAALPGTHQLIGQLLYGTGMRLLECLRLRIKDVDFERNQITVRDGKGFKDRVTMLPDKLKGELSRHLERVKLLHEQDLAQGGGRVYLPYALAEKYPNANPEWAWPRKRLRLTRRSSIGCGNTSIHVLRVHSAFGIRSGTLHWVFGRSASAVGGAPTRTGICNFLSRAVAANLL